MAILHDAGVHSEPKPSATVVLIRDADPGLQLLLLERRRRDPAKARGPWVFPGGKVEARDRNPQTDGLGAARQAVVRETLEEAGIEIDPDALVPISRWITPELATRRFDTWFFLGPFEAAREVCVDGSEIEGHCWLTPHAALDAHEREEIRLAPPTFVTVNWMASYNRTCDALEHFARASVQVFRPRICSLDQGACMLYPGDAGYADGAMERSGARNRLWITPGGWRYEHDH